MVTVSADIYTDFDFSTLRPSTTLPAHIVLVPLKPGHSEGDFDLTANQLVTNTPRNYLFGNIACFDMHPFAAMPFDRYSIAKLFRNWAKQQQLSGELYTGIWFDTGTPARLKLAQTS